MEKVTKWHLQMDIKMSIDNDHQKWTVLMNIKNERYQRTLIIFIIYVPEQLSTLNVHIS